jgi:hypothetical protein
VHRNTRHFIRCFALGYLWGTVVSIVVGLVVWAALTVSYL